MCTDSFKGTPTTSKYSCKPIPAALIVLVVKSSPHQQSTLQVGQNVEQHMEGVVSRVLAFSKS